jgi:hypothetical protein
MKGNIGFGVAARAASSAFNSFSPVGVVRHLPMVSFISLSFSSRVRFPLHSI